MLQHLDLLVTFFFRRHNKMHPILTSLDNIFHFILLTAFLQQNTCAFTITNVHRATNQQQQQFLSSTRRSIVDNDMQIHPNQSGAVTSRHSQTNHPKIPSHVAHVVHASGAHHQQQHFLNFSSLSSCRLPADFWCDDPAVALACTGTLAYCEAYRRARLGRKLNMQLAFETACPDSQKYVVNRLYPAVLNNPDLAPFLEFRAFPWGLAKRQGDQQIRCHHGPRECLANRLLSCALNYYKWDRPKNERILFCFMDNLMDRNLDPEQGMASCLATNWVGQEMIGGILRCAQSAEANAFQVDDERGTEQILNRRWPRFVPFVSLNSKANVHMQAPLQLLLPEKIRHWNRTLSIGMGDGRWRKSLLSNQQSLTATDNCEFPPEFWCSDPAITRLCFSAVLCDQFMKTNFGKPVELRIIYNSQFGSSRDYLARIVRAKLLDPNLATKFAENVGKMRLELEPAHLTKSALTNECGVGNQNNRRRLGHECARRILEICIASTIEHVDERNRHLMCLNSLAAGNHYAQQFDGPAPGEWWAMNCFPAAMQRERILQCTSTEAIWLERNVQLVNKQNQQALGPADEIQRKGMDFWVLVNGYSLSSVQQYAHVLDQMICLWYRGYGHDRDGCGRCDYEPSHC